MILLLLVLPRDLTMRLGVSILAHNDCGRTLRQFTTNMQLLLAQRPAAPVRTNRFQRFRNNTDIGVERFRRINSDDDEGNEFFRKEYEVVISRLEIVSDRVE